MSDLLFRNLEDMQARKKHDEDLVEINYAIKYHKAIIKFLNDTEDMEIQQSLKHHKHVLDSLKNVKKGILNKREQVKNSLKSRGLNY